MSPFVSQSITQSEEIKTLVTRHPVLKYYDMTDYRDYRECCYDFNDITLT